MSRNDYFTMRKFKRYISLVKADLYRYEGSFSFLTFISQLSICPGFQYSFWMRTCTYSKNDLVLKFVIFPFSRLILNHYIYKYGIDISYRMNLGGGLCIGHTGGIVVNAKAVIGKNCNLSHEVTIGIVNRGDKQGCPTIGDNVYIGPGAKIIGNIRIGNGVAVGANCVVTHDIPDNAVVVGIPGKVISYKGSVGYINRIDYDVEN